jgi:hypothetical protein
MTNPLDDFMGGGGAKSFPFEQPGATVTGKITKLPERKQQTDVNTGAPRVFANSGEPMYVYIVEIQTQFRDPTDPQDDGKRSLWLKGGKWDAANNCGASLRAVQEAIRASGAKLPSLGGDLTLQFVGHGPAERGKNAPKYYWSQYVPPVAGGFMSAEIPAAQGYAVPQQVQYANQQVQSYPNQGAQQYAQPAQQLLPPPPIQPASPQQNAVMEQLRAQQQAAVSQLQAQSPHQSTEPIPF